MLGLRWDLKTDGTTFENAYFFKNRHSEFQLKYNFSHWRRINKVGVLGGNARKDSRLSKGVAN